MLEFVLLQAAAAKSNPILQFLPIVAIIVVFYFFMIRPQQKKAKDQKNFRESLKKGDNVVTIGGMHGKIASIEADDTIMVEVDKGIKLKFEKSSISAESTKKVQPAAVETK
jgi:preprotein translocase subunit YajC